MKKPRVVIAGQIPPPYGGQNIMIQKAVAQFAALPECESIHLPFFFTSDFQTARKAGWRKVLELIRIVVRLLRIRARGPIDLVLYPTGGPQLVPMVRDILLLPWILLCARRVVLHFHAAGIADRLQGTPGTFTAHLLSAVYRRAAGAVVMAEFNRRDPEFFGIKEIIVRPHKISDEFEPALAAREKPSTSGERLLYVGHLHPDKGTDALLRAFAAVSEGSARLTLELVGECLPPWTRKEVEALVDSLSLRSRVVLSGVLTGRAKAKAFARADLFVFPTVAPYESFGLVLVEAMMWGLPIVASDWRGNRDVLTTDTGALVFPVSAESLEQNLRNALAEALGKRARWLEWGRKNRALYELTYKEVPHESWLARALFAIFPTR